MDRAVTIFEQIGGGQFAVVSGCFNFEAEGNTLRMVIRRNKSKANRLSIEYNTKTRLNTMRFTNEARTVRLFKDIPGTRLQEVFTKYTGLSTSKEAS